jgi:hypothetical protein
MKAACSKGHVMLLRWQDSAYRDQRSLPRPGQSAFMRRVMARPERRNLQSQIAVRVNRSWHTHEFLDRRGRLWRLKSSLELSFAGGLDRLELTWDYEPHTLLLSDGRRYTPDFWVHEWETYVEVKGRPVGLDKVAIAQQQGIPVRLLQGRHSLAEALTPQSC